MNHRPPTTVRLLDRLLRRFPPAWYVKAQQDLLKAQQEFDSLRSSDVQ